MSPIAIGFRILLDIAFVYLFFWFLYFSEENGMYQWWVLPTQLLGGIALFILGAAIWFI